MPLYKHCQATNWQLARLLMLQNNHCKAIIRNILVLSYSSSQYRKTLFETVQLIACLWRATRQVVIKVGWLMRHRISTAIVALLAALTYNRPFPWKRKDQRQKSIHGWTINQLARSAYTVNRTTGARLWFTANWWSVIDLFIQDK